ncbi:hypothetical protein A1Q1_04529 [Trichosporon asahii var. asahii CBS 2479]|uniref:Rad51-like C-terminal domain-containing protein n=1 Tax=Trichosporon asahii var. asahii (strain ATCC 90039 / CBS 2479 / JCM 2466 / KCTC 7840 / NBRC 103889/ NCYC 2677 / UAMH 7654) TaxID=1186058 RepID=J5RF71_TRIAS|nr:hypothetical protein A1Q1_04529 [Trichosporon asahii var. asahii CBS 2479]EJT52318.1 hypothetical protein A1Q1_04529 [Trichosporon asahii var. asahii CBS 2479]
MSENGDEGINVSDIGKLKANGIVTVLGVAQTPRKNLAKIKAKIEKLKVSLRAPELKLTNRKSVPSCFFATGVEVSERRTTVFTISTGSKAVDGMLGGGISTQSITEVYGEFRTGKVCVRTAQLYRGTFRPDRVRAVADRFGVDGQQALENILCARAWSSEQQCELLVELAIQFAAASSAKPVGGELVHGVRADHRPCPRACLRKGRGEERIAKLQDSPDMPEGEATYCLKSGEPSSLRGRVSAIGDAPRADPRRKEKEGELIYVDLELMSATKREDLQASPTKSLCKLPSAL